MTVTPSPRSVVVPLEDWQHGFGALKNAKARLPMGAAIGNVSDALSKVEHLQPAPAPSSLAGGEVLDPAYVTRLITLARECERLGPSNGLDTPENMARARARQTLISATRPNAILAALSPEAPAREGGKIFFGDEITVRMRVTDPKEQNDYRGLHYIMCADPWDEAEEPIPVLTSNVIASALTPRHEAPASVPADVARLVIAARTVAFSGARPTREEINELDTASEAFASRVPWEDEPESHEAPAEGAGEREGRDAEVRVAAVAAGALVWQVYGGEWCLDPSIEFRSDLIKVLALRARSSAPEAREGLRLVDEAGDTTPAMFEAREGEAVAYVDDSERGSIRWGRNSASIPNGTELFTHPAAPSADKLRIAVEALEKIERWHGQFPETGKFWPNDDKTPSDRPVSYSAQYGSNGERDFMRSVAGQALADLKAEGA